METYKLIDRWFSSCSGGLYLLVMPHKTTFNLDSLKIATMQSLQRNGVCVDIRKEGYDSKTAILQEFARAFEFPDYFGMNWDALEECLTDLSWLPATCYCLFFNEAIHLLEKQKEDRNILFNILSDVSKFWCDQSKPVSFITFIVCHASEEHVMLNRLKNSNADFEVIKADES